MKNLFAFVFIMMVCFSLLSCGGQSLSGIYTDDLGFGTYEFSKKNVTFHSNASVLQGTYTEKDGTVTISYANGYTNTLTFNTESKTLAHTALASSSDLHRAAENTAHLIKQCVNPDTLKLTDGILVIPNSDDKSVIYTFVPHSFTNSSGKTVEDIAVFCDQEYLGLYKVMQDADYSIPNRADFDSYEAFQAKCRELLKDLEAIQEYAGWKIMQVPLPDFLNMTPDPDYVWTLVSQKDVAELLKLPYVESEE